MSSREPSIPRLMSGRHYGNLRLAAELAGLKLTETMLAANSSLPLHTHEQPYVSIVLNGIGSISDKRRSLVCERQMVLYHPRGEIHTDSIGKVPGHCLCIDLGDNWEARLPRPEEPVSVRGGLANWLGTRLHGELKQQDSFSCLAVEGLMLELLAELGRSHKADATHARPDWLRTIVDRLEAMEDPPQTVGELAALAGVHPAHLARAFRKYHGCTPADYLRRRRLELARRLLASTDDPIADIALHAGFSDQSHLNKVFRKQLGTTPLQFRADVRG